MKKIKSLEEMLDYPYYKRCLEKASKKQKEEPKRRIIQPVNWAEKIKKENEARLELLKRIHKSAFYCQKCGKLDSKKDVQCVLKNNFFSTKPDFSGIKVDIEMTFICKKCNSELKKIGGLNCLKK